MKREDILTQVKLFIGNGKMTYEGIRLEENTNIRYDLALDSIEILELAIDLERFYGIEIDEFELMDCETIGNVVDHVMSKL